MIILPQPKPGSRQCQYCGNQRSNDELHDEPGGVVICFLCRQRRSTELAKLFMGEPPSRCSWCRGSVDKGFKLHWLDNTHVALCVKCSPIAVHKKREMYRPTVFGQMEKI